MLASTLSSELEDFVEAKFLLSACPCWRHLAHPDYRANSRVLLSGVTCTVSIPYLEMQGRNFTKAELKLIIITITVIIMIIITTINRYNQLTSSGC